MEQPNEQHVRQSDEQRRGFRPGVSGHPRGGGLTFKDRLTVEVEAMVTDFARVHGRVPTYCEAATIGNVARLQLRLRRPARAEDLVRLTNTSRRLLRTLGLDAKPREAAADADAPPMPSGYGGRK